MSITVDAADAAFPPVSPSLPGLALGAAPQGFRGRIRGLRAEASGGLPAEEIERRLLELGFVEGARVEILHQGLFGRDPIAVRVDNATIALRRREALAILVEPLG
ncbi:MAG: ferrous iron transport protein A [Acetobacteraceae bacterium]|nr:MAG: ferrous iron transport protein A [Acetobacteraceae bacterium]